MFAEITLLRLVSTKFLRKSLKCIIRYNSDTIIQMMFVIWMGPRLLCVREFYFRNKQNISRRFVIQNHNKIGSVVIAALTKNFDFKKKQSSAKENIPPTVETLQLYQYIKHRNAIVILRFNQLRLTHSTIVPISSVWSLRCTMNRNPKIDDCLLSIQKQQTLKW